MEKRGKLRPAVFRDVRARHSFLALLSTYALEYFGYLLVVPLLPPLLLNAEGGVIPPGSSEAVRTLWVGILLGLFGIAQFVAAPLLGTAADRFGCKRVLLLCIAGSAVGHAIVAMGFFYESLSLLFVGRVWSGLSSAGIALSQAAVSQLVAPEHRSRAFGYLLGFGALGAVMGPLVAGRFAYVGPVHGVFPLVLGCLGSLLNLVVLALYLGEHKREAELVSLLDIPRFFRERAIRYLLAALLLFFLARAGYSLFFSTYLAQRYGLSSQTIGYLYAYMGAIFVFVGVLVNDRLTRRFPARFLAAAGTITNGIGAILTVLSPDWRYLLFVIPICTLGSAVAQPNFSSLLSRAAPSSHQGRIFGVSSSLWSLTQAVSPITAGLLARWGYWLPMGATAIGYLLAGLRLYSFRAAPAVAQSPPEE